MRKIALVLAVAAVGEGLIALHLVRQLHAERENVQSLQARVAQLEQASSQRAAGAMFVAVPTQPPASPFTVDGQSAPAQPAPGATNLTSAANASVPSNAPVLDRQQMREQMTAAITRQRTLLQDPEYREAMLSQQKMMLMRSNPDVAKELDLTADQKDRLFGTLAEQSLRAMESVNMREEPPDPTKLQELQRQAAEQQRANEAELRAVLGDAKYNEWQEYQATGGVRWEATRLRTSLANAGVPLDESLAKPLMKVLQEQQKQEMQRLEQYAANQPRAANRGFFTAVSGENVVQLMTNSVESLEKTQRRRREALAALLTPEQLEVIDDEHNAELQMQRAQERLMRAQQAAGGLDPTLAPAISYAAEPAVTVAPPSD